LLAHAMAARDSLDDARMKEIAARKSEHQGTVDWTGQTWGSLRALRYVNHGKNGARWVFLCGCGNEKVMPVRFVRNGKRPTCGCGTKRAPAPERTNPAVLWPFPFVVGLDGVPVSPVWRSAGR
jgi:hypothetical protein